MRVDAISPILNNHRLPQTIPYHRVARHARTMSHLQQIQSEWIEDTLWEPPLVWFQMNSNEDAGAMSLGFFDNISDSDLSTSSSTSTNNQQHSQSSARLVSMNHDNSLDSLVSVSSSVNFESPSTPSVISEPNSPSRLYMPSPSSNNSSLASSPAASPSSSPLQSPRVLSQFPVASMSSPVRTSTSLKRSREVMESTQLSSTTSSSLASSRPTW